MSDTKIVVISCVRDGNGSSVEVLSVPVEMDMEETRKAYKQVRFFPEPYLMFSEWLRKQPGCTTADVEWVIESFTGD